MLKKIAGPTCHISLLPAASSLLPLCFARVTPISSRRRRFKPPPLHIAALHRRALAHAAAHRHGRQPPFQAAAARPRARPAPPVRTCAARARLRAPAPPVHPCHAPPSHALSRHSHTPCHPRSRAFTLFTPQPQTFSARQVFVFLPDRDGSREEEGKGSCGREARSQADSCREGGREGRDGGQGHRGAGVRPCSPVRDQGFTSQRQRQRPRYEPSQRCQGHQSHDSSSSSDRFRWF